MSNDRRLVRLTDVQQKPQPWLWKPQVPSEATTVITGDPAQAKSRVTYDLAARVTTGRPMPNCQEGSPPAGVVLLQAEDAVDSTVKPALLAAGADLNRVFVYNPASFGNRPLVLPDDLPLVKAAVDEVRAKLLVIDPATALIDCNPDSEKSVRKALRPLDALAKEKGLAVLLVRHLNKSGRGSPLYQAAGSIGWVAAARSALMAMSDPTSSSPYDHLLLQIKTNLASAVTLGYRTVMVDGNITVEWLGPRSVTVQHLGRGEHDDSSRLQEAMEVLFLILRNGPDGAKDVYKKAAEAGVARKTLERAKKALGVPSCRRRFGIWNWTWVWLLPDQDNEMLAYFRQKYDALDAAPPTNAPAGTPS